MGSILHGKNRSNGNFTLNLMGSEILSYLGWGLKKKYGVYAPLLKDDCICLGKILHNKARVLELWQTYPNLQNMYNIYLTTYNRKTYMNTPSEIQWLHSLADWFIKCGGLIPEAGIITCEDCECYTDKCNQPNECKYEGYGLPINGGAK